jgi:hypothetical protein
MKPTILNYVVLMLSKLPQNPGGTILTMLLIALSQSVVSKAMILVNWAND